MGVKKSDTRVRSKPETVFIVDYDIPSKPVSAHTRFYRSLSLLKKRFGYEGASSDSVLKTSDQLLAIKIYELAIAYGGQATVWKATKLTNLL